VTARKPRQRAAKGGAGARAGKRATTGSKRAIAARELTAIVPKSTTAALERAKTAPKTTARPHARELEQRGRDLHARTPEPVARTLVFTYGTLLSGEPNHRYLAHARLVGEGRTQAAFALYNLRYYPGLVQAGAQAVAGEVYEVDEPTLAALDRLESHPNFYRRTSIVLESGLAVQAYLLTAEQVAGHPIIHSGAWKTRHGSETPS
jgi:gamma-glutamylaminecyclotransferase